MNFTAWVIVGAVAGVIASNIIKKGGRPAFHVILLGVVGSIDGGYIYERFGVPNVSSIDLPSIVAAISSACIVLYLYDAVVPRRI